MYYWILYSSACMNNINLLGKIVVVFCLFGQNSQSVFDGVIRIGVDVGSMYSLFNCAIIVFEVISLMSFFRGGVRW